MEAEEQRHDHRSSLLVPRIYAGGQVIRWVRCVAIRMIGRRVDGQRFGRKIRDKARVRGVIPIAMFRTR